MNLNTKILPLAGKGNNNYDKFCQTVRVVAIWVFHLMPSEKAAAVQLRVGRFSSSSSSSLSSSLRELDKWELVSVFFWTSLGELDKWTMVRLHDFFANKHCLMLLCCCEIVTRYFFLSFWGSICSEVLWKTTVLITRSCCSLVGPAFVRPRRLNSGIEGGGKKKKKVFECAFLLLLIFCGKIRWT